MVVMRKLNRAAQQQNAGIDSGDFKVKAPEKWLFDHAGNDAPVPPERRIFDVSGAPPGTLRTPTRWLC